MDAFGHVNNAAYFRYFESARIAWLERAGWTDLRDTHGVGVILHSVQARFRRPVQYPDTLSVSARLVELNDDRFTLAHEAWSERQNALAAEASGIVVAYDYRDGTKARIPDGLRASILRFNPFP